MRTKSSAARGRRKRVHGRGILLALAVLALPAVQAQAAQAHTQDQTQAQTQTMGDATRVDMLRKQWLEERAQLDRDLRELQQALARHRAADVAQARELETIRRQQQALATALQGQVADLQRANTLAWSTGGLALLLLAGIAAVANTRAGRAQARDLQAQLEAIERRHANELRALRNAIQGQGQGNASRAGTVQHAADGAAKAAPTAVATPARTPAAPAATATGRSDTDATASTRVAPVPVPAPTPTPARTATATAASPARAGSDGAFAADTRVVMHAPIEGLRRNAPADADAHEPAPHVAAPALAAAAAAAAAAAQTVVSTPPVNAVERTVELEMVYDPSSLVIEEERGTMPAEVEARWQSLTGAPLTQVELQPGATAEPRSALRGNLTMENHAGTFAASHTNLANARAARAGDVHTDAAGDAATPAGPPQMDTVDPARISSAGAWPGPAEHAELRARLAELELHDQLRRELNAQPELLRGLVEEALGVVLKPTQARTIEDWRLLVLDAWRRDNMQEALARTDSMVAAATTDGDRTRAHMHRALVLDRMERLGEPVTLAAPRAAGDDTSAAGVDAADLAGSIPAVSHAAALREAVRLRRDVRDHAAARAVLTDLLGRLQPGQDATQARIWMRALVNLALVEAAPGGDVERAIALYERVVLATQGIAEGELTSAQATSAAQALFNRAVLRYERQQDVDGAVDDYRQVVARFGARAEPDVLLTVAHALSNDAWLQANVYRAPEAAATRYLELDRKFGERRDRELALLAASALFAAAVLSARELGTPDAALDLYRRLLNRHELTTDRAFVALVAKSLFNIGALLGADAQTRDQAIEAYDALVARCADGDDAQFADWVAGGLVNKAGLLLRQGDVAAARVTYARTVSEFASTASRGAAEQVARALFNLAGIASQQGDSTSAIAAYEELLQRAPAQPSLRHELLVARGLSSLAYLHANVRQDNARALRTFAQLLERFRTREEPELAEQCARALLAVGVLNASRRQDFAAAVAAYDELATRHGHRSEPQVAITVAKGLFNLAALQARQMQDLRGTLVTLNRLVDRFTGYHETEVEVRVVSGLLMRARVQERLAETAAARDSCQALVTRYGSHPDPRVHKYVVAAHRMLGTAAPAALASTAGQATDDLLLP